MVYCDWFTTASLDYFNITNYYKCHYNIRQLLQFTLVPQRRFKICEIRFNNGRSGNAQYHTNQPSDTCTMKTTARLTERYWVVLSHDAVHYTLPRSMDYTVLHGLENLEAKFQELICNSLAVAKTGGNAFCMRKGRGGMGVLQVYLFSNGEVRRPFWFSNKSLGTGLFFGDSKFSWPGRCFKIFWSTFPGYTLSRWTLWILIHTDNEDFRSNNLVSLAPPYHQLTWVPSPPWEVDLFEAATRIISQQHYRVLVVLHIGYYS